MRKRYYYDLHLHSCLSPCADDDMTPNHIAGMALLAGLELVALTDHNSCQNCPAFFKASERYGLIPIAGMELTTAEVIHIVCLFEFLEDALAFHNSVDRQRIRIPNRTEIFGNQLLRDEQDELIGEEPDLLSNATRLTLEQVPLLVHAHHGVCYPAHVNREVNGILGVLGDLPPYPQFSAVEFHDAEHVSSYLERFPRLSGLRTIVSSDAHYLWDIRDRSQYVELESGNGTVADVRRQLFVALRGG